VVVTETWFFRDPEAFGVVAEAGRACRAGTSLRILTVPCSSGEEPYSLAIALQDAGVAAERVRIEAADISSRALARARNGVYSKNSFRGKDLGYRARYFHSTKSGFVLQTDIRNCVKFFEGNLLNSGFAAGQSYDFIFCRNLLIYFDRATQLKALEKLEALLAPGGILFVGPAEQPLALEHGFISANFSRAFACRKAVALENPKLPHGAARVDEEWKMPSPLPFALSPSIKLSEAPAAIGGAARPTGNETALPGIGPISQPERQPMDPDLDAARQLADAGRLGEAAAICERYLETDGDSAQGWYLLGLIRDASGDVSAVDCYRRALYLKPDHYETLLQMALWLQKNGDSTRARTFKARAERAKPETFEIHKARYA
jgi:chemotaxis protein methyltransferase WspC